MKSISPILAHSSFFFDDLQLSAREFYTKLEQAVQSFEYPNLSLYRVLFTEGGAFSAQREYLCIQSKGYLFYICAAPYGRSFFVSWWLKEQTNILFIILLTIPFLGRMIARRSSQKTFYQFDTELLFRESIERVIKTTIEELKHTKGFRKKSLDTHKNHD